MGTVTIASSMATQSTIAVNFTFAPCAIRRGIPLTAATTSATAVRSRGIVLEIVIEDGVDRVWMMVAVLAAVAMTEKQSDLVFRVGLWEGLLLLGFLDEARG